ncbi:hypothetical protein M758_UG254400 [Ceratodon purpureus]|nr:hypothetical protein M758_UG254400 [Ceratodon purpureus]
MSLMGMAMVDSFLTVSWATLEAITGDMGRWRGDAILVRLVEDSYCCGGLKCSSSGGSSF